MWDPGLLPADIAVAGVEEISRGRSGDGKYAVETEDGRKLLLRVSGAEKYPLRRKEYAFLRHLNDAGIPMPRAVSFGKCLDGSAVYTLVTWLEGEPAEAIVPGLPSPEQYALGRESGRILRRVHDASPRGDKLPDWYDRYMAVIGPRLDAYCAEGPPFDGADRVLRYLEGHRNLLHGRPQTGHHGDYHLGNMIVSPGGELSVIDWHTVDFEDGGDPWFEFNRVGAAYPAFACGQIDGYFGDSVPDAFWPLFMLYLSVSALTSLVWAKHHKPEASEEILQLNLDIQRWFDDMKNPVPVWYRGFSKR